MPIFKPNICDSEYCTGKQKKGYVKILYIWIKFRKLPKAFLYGLYYNGGGG